MTLSVDERIEYAHLSTTASLTPWRMSVGGYNRLDELHAKAQATNK